MARLFDNASSQYLEVNNAPATAYPFTWAAWGMSDDATYDGCVAFLGDKDVAGEFWRMEFRGSQAGDPFAFGVRQATVENLTYNAVTTTGFTANVWHHVCGVATSSTSRDAFIDGGSKGSSTTDRTPGGTDRFSIGRMGDSTPGDYFSGNLAEVAFWDVALTDAEVAILAKGYSPLFVRPTSLVFYCPIIGRTSPEIEIRKGVNMTVTGAVASAHPRIIYPSSAQIRRFTTAVGANKRRYTLPLLGMG